MDIVKTLAVALAIFAVVDTLGPDWRPSAKSESKVAVAGLTLLSPPEFEEAPADYLADEPTTQEPVAPEIVKPVAQTQEPEKKAETCVDGSCAKPSVAPVVYESQPVQVYYYTPRVVRSVVQVPMNGDCSQVAASPLVMRTPVRTVARGTVNYFRECQPVRSVVRRVFTCR